MSSKGRVADAISSLTSAINAHRHDEARPSLGNRARLQADRRMARTSAAVTQDGSLSLDSSENNF